MVVFFVRELASDPPALTQKELQGYRIRLNDAEAASLMTTCRYLRFAFCEQFSSNAPSPAFPEHPQITNPLLMGQHDSNNLRLADSDPSEGPIIPLKVQRYRIRSKEVTKGFLRDRFYQSSHGVVLMRLRLPNNHIDGHLSSLRLLAVGPDKR